MSLFSSSPRNFGLFCIALLLTVGVNAEARKKKKKSDAPPPVGWHIEEGWAHQCYFGPDFVKLPDTDRRMARSSVLDEMMKQWSGQMNDGISLDAAAIEKVETTLLGRPEKVEQVVISNLEKCKTSATSGGIDSSAWNSWLRGLSSQLTAGECLTPFNYTMFDYLDIGTDWQRTMPLCAGDRVRISGSSTDKFRISEGGGWITVEGDTTLSTLGSENHPCNLEGCWAGMLIARFVTESGVETILVVGLQTTFEAPEHGELSYRINDNTFYDNKWYQHGGLVDHTAIEISPAK